MEKNDPKQRHRRCFVLKKMLNIMKLTTLILFIPLFQVAAHSYAQETRLNLKFENETLENVFSKIEQSSDFSIFYKNELIKNSKEVSGDFKNVLIFEVLDQILKTENLTYSVKDKLIMIVPKESATTEMGSQQKSVAGKVTDASGGSLPGVSVVVKGTTIGVITDNEGKYSLQNIPENGTLQFSFMGMKMQEVVVGNKTAINITLSDEAIGIEEVVAIGYGTQKKVNLTGSISSIDVSSIESIPASNLSSALAGKLTGVTISVPSGIPGVSSSLKIRADGTWNNNSPLYVIDGIVSDKTAFDALDASMVENLSVIKDAASSAIYGSRAANGVVLVNTKRGKEGKAVISYSGSFGLEMPTKTPDVMSAYDQANFMNTVYKYRYNYSVDNPKLAFEGERAWDLKRRGLFLEKIRAQGITVQDFMLLFPIPDEQIKLNKNLIQNPGW